MTSCNKPQNPPVISFVLNAHFPFIRSLRQEEGQAERAFFETLSETFIPLLEVFDRLDQDHVPFRMGISLSPTLCHMLTDELLIKRFLDYMDRQIEFGAYEIQNLDDPALGAVVEHFYDRLVEKRFLFTVRYESDLLKVFEHYQRKGRLELLTTSATHAYLPFYTGYHEAVQAQLEVAVQSYRFRFGKYPQGFWLPELGWSPELDSWLRSYNFAYTMVETHGLVLGRPAAEKGSFFPARTPLGICLLGRDFFAAEDVKAMKNEAVFRDNRKDLGFELPPEHLGLFLDSQGGRTSTGYKAQNRGGGLYDFRAAERLAAEKAALFLNRRIERLNAASEYLSAPPISLCAFNAESFGKLWHEGPAFLENIFRLGARKHSSGELNFMTPAEYIYKLDTASFQTLMPEYSSWGPQGFAEAWLDASNDWMYRHTMRALDRMIEIADRFPDNSGLKERTLNQAAREILLSMASDWSKMLYKQEDPDFARSQIETSLRNFTTIYEALGSNYISTEWLTNLEKRHNIFPNINYRVFRRKHKKDTN
jgi:1,4-alpha-glucan branching enzyme